MIIIVLLPVLYSVLCGLFSYAETKKKKKSLESCHVFKSAGVFFCEVGFVPKLV